jgi:hypothetical protein
VRNTATA